MPLGAAGACRSQGHAHHPRPAPGGFWNFLRVWLCRSEFLLSALPLFFHQLFTSCSHSMHMVLQRPRLELFMSLNVKSSTTERFWIWLNKFRWQSIHTGHDNAVTPDLCVLCSSGNFLVFALVVVGVKRFGVRRSSPAEVLWFDTSRNTGSFLWKRHDGRVPHRRLRLQRRFHGVLLLRRARR